MLIKFNQSKSNKQNFTSFYAKLFYFIKYIYIYCLNIICFNSSFIHINLKAFKIKSKIIYNIYFLIVKLIHLITNHLNMANLFHILKILSICLLFSINPSLCMENGDSFNPSNNGQGIIALVLLVCLFGHFIYYTFKPSISVDEEDNIMFGPENKPIQLNSINEIDLLQFLYNCKFIIFGFLLLMLLVVLVFLIRSYKSRKCCFQGNNQIYNVIVNGVWSTKVKIVVMSFLDIVLSSFPLYAIKFISIYLNIVSIVFGIVLIISLYSLINIITFVSILFCLLVFSSFIIFVREFNINFTTSFIQLIIKRDYSKYLQRIILIKFMLFYIYITSDFSLCESTWSKFAHDVFIGVGNQIGVQPKTTVSTLETIGMIAVIGSIGVGSIHLYNWSTGNIKPSIDDRLNIIEHQLNQNSRQLINMSECQRDYAEINANAFGAIGTAMSVVEKNNVNILNNLNTKIDEINNKINIIEAKILDNQDSMKQYINSNVKEKLTSLEIKFNSFYDRSNLTEEDKRVLLEISNDINNVGIHLESIPLQSNNLERALAIAQSPTSTFQYRPTLSPKVIESLNKTMNNEIKVVHNHRSSSTSNISLLPDSKTPHSTDFERYQTVKFLITNNKIKSVSINDTVVPSSNIITSIGNKIFNHIPTEFILKTVSTAIANTLSGTMTMYAFNTLLASFGFGSGSINTSRTLPSTMSSSERAGHTLITSLKEFLRGLRGGL